MTAIENAAGLRPVNTDDGTPPELSERARRLIARVKRHGIDDMSERELAEVLGIDRKTWDNILAGRGRASSLQKAEAGLERWVAEHGAEDEESAGIPFTLTVNVGALNLEVTGSGAREDADMIREQVTKMVADWMRRGPE